MDTPPLETMLQKQASSVLCGHRVSATAVASVVKDISEPQSSCSHSLTPVRAAGLKQTTFNKLKTFISGAINKSDFATQKSKILSMIGDI